MKFVHPRRYRLTLRAMVALIIVAYFVEYFIEFAWPGILPTKPPTTLPIVVAGVVFLFWIAPLVVWIYYAIQNSWRFYFADLPADWKIVFSWGFFGSIVWQIVFSRGFIGSWPNMVFPAIFFGLTAVGASLFFDGVPVVNALYGVTAAVFFAFYWDHNESSARVWLHGIHEQHYLSWFLADSLTWLNYGAAVFIGAMIVLLSNLVRPCKRRASASQLHGNFGNTQNQAPTPVTSPEVHGKYVQEKQRELELALQGEETERQMFALLKPLESLGWTVERNVWIPGPKVGDIDALVTSPSDVVYAIDAKQRRNAQVVFDTATSDITVIRSNGATEVTKFLETALRQAQALENHGRRPPVQPVLCFFGSHLACEQMLRGVTILDSGDLINWLTSPGGLSPLGNSIARKNPNYQADV